MKKILSIREIFNSDIPKYWEFIGSGGKTSALINFVRLLHGMESSPNILYGTTVHMAAPLSERNGFSCSEEGVFADYPGTFVKYGSYEDTEAFWNSSPSGRLIMTGRLEVKNGRPKLTGLSSEEADKLCGLPDLDFMLTESDGSRQLPIKAHAGFEPVLYSKAEIGCAVIGLNALGCRVCAEEVHRPELLCRILRCSLGHIINEHDFAAAACAYLDILPTKKHILIFSQAEKAEDEELRRMKDLVCSLRREKSEIIFLCQAFRELCTF